MFQTFESAGASQSGPDRTRRLRALLPKAGVDAFLVPRADEHQGEYVAPCAERLRWLTGFSGSAGLAVVAEGAAAVFVDGRYTVQARAQIDTSVFDILQLPEAKLSDWLGAKLRKGAKVGFDPWLHTAAEIERLDAALTPKGIKLRPVAVNLVDRAWGKDRPAAPRGAVVPQPLKLAGRSAEDKIAVIQKQLKEEGHDAVVLTLPDSIAWAFNIRGADVAHNPVPLAFAIIPAQGKPELFIAPEKLTPEARTHLDQFAKRAPPDALADRLKGLRTAGRKVRLDPERAALAIFRRLGSKAVARGSDPCILLKAIKNPVEIRGARAAHLRDGVAVTRFLEWLDREAPKGTVDEIEAVRQLEGFRRQTNALKEISFDTISGSGPNGAIVHYRVTEATNRRLMPGELFLVDSGGQYADGTTDITRTVAIGRPSQEMRERFTLVLKAHIAIATARFPKGTRGHELDPFARRPLWEHGLDFDHGTGHGVGSYLSVHEGPQSISRRGMAVLEPGMIISNEPGYYKEGAYGIRIENLVLVTPLAKLPGGDREMMSLETLTLCPIDRRLVAAELLTTEERAWLNAYHSRVRDTLSPRLDSAVRAWLTAATAPI
jgi:Xaa-Pro aminopeptidase